MACILHPQTIFLPLAACCFLNVHITPFFPDAPILLALVEILHITKLHVVTASVQFSVCDIFTWVHAHGMALACWDYSFSVLVGGSPTDELDGRVCALYYFDLESGHVVHLCTQFWRIKSFGLKKTVSVDPLINQYFHFLL